MAAQSGCRNMAIRPGCRRCASAIADHLATTRGIVADPSRIIIVSRHPGRHQHRGAAVSATRHSQRGRGSRAIRARPSPSRRPAPRSISVAGRCRRADRRRAAAAADGAALRDAVASISDRRTRCRCAPPRHRSPGRGGTAATSSKTITTAISATRARRCRRSPRWRRTAPSISARFPSRSAPACGSATWWCPTQLAEARRGRESAAQQRQSLARAGGAGRIDAQRQLCRASACASAPHYRESRDCLLAALRRNFGDVERERRGRRAARLLASAARRSRRRDGRRRWRGARASGSIRWPPAAPTRRAPSALTRRGLILGYAALSPQADRARHRAAVGRHRRCARRSQRRRQRALRRARSPPPAPSRIGAAAGNLAPDFRQQPALAARPPTSGKLVAAA